MIAVNQYDIICMRRELLTAVFKMQLSCVDKEQQKGIQTLAVYAVGCIANILRAPQAVEQMLLRKGRGAVKIDSVLMDDTRFDADNSLLPYVHMRVPFWK